MSEHTLETMYLNDGSGTITTRVPTTDEEAEQALALCSRNEGMRRTVIALYRVYRIQAEGAFNLDVLGAFERVLQVIVGVGEDEP